MMDAVWKFSDKGEFFLNGSWTQTDAAFDELQVAVASDVPTSLFPGGSLPGLGPDPSFPIAYSDFSQMDEVHEYSELDYTEVRGTLGVRYQARPSLGLFASMSLYDLTDDEPMFKNTVGQPDMDATGSVTLVSGGLVWSF